MANEMKKEPVETIIGKKARIYNTGDMLTEDYIPERVNIELSDSDVIVRIWMG